MSVTASPSKRHAASSRPQRQPHPVMSNLPRFHPANYVSPQTTSPASRPSSASTSPAMVFPDPSPQLTPRTSRQTPNQLTDAQRQLYAYHSELYNLNRPSSSRGSGPGSPNLRPLSSPGAVTPLELEESDDYLDVGSKNAANASTGKKGS
ncbi:MAG: hypothetical protein Q9162_002907 [Coniocarpon cinnabarinum]